MTFRCGYCPALSVRDGPAHRKSCPRYKPPAPRKGKHNVVPTTGTKDVQNIYGQYEPKPVSGWRCKRCGTTWWECTKPWPRDKPECDLVIVQNIMES